MEFAGNLLDTLRGPVVQSRQDGGAVDWPELRARFSAAHAAALEMGLNRGIPGVLPGSFDNWNTALRGDFEGTPHVNRTGLADSKRAARKGGGNAGNMLAGG
ncbi:MAG: hypothetical protein ACKOPG_08835 [Novosphingobium sp.]